MQLENPNYHPYLNNIITLQEWQQQQKKLEQFPKQMCSLPIHKGERLWKCYDCSLDQEVVCMCTDCFKHSDHKGHRIYFYHKQSDEASCDCGDTSQPFQLFCSKHQKDQQLPLQDLLNSVSSLLQEKILNLLQFEFIKSFNLIITGGEQNIKQANQTLKSAFNFIVFLMHDKLPFVFLISNFFIKPLQNFKVNHICDDYDDIEIIQQNNEKFSKLQMHDCFCNILQNLFRYNQFYDNQFDQLASDTLKLMFLNFDYKIILSETFCKMLNFLLIKIEEKSFLLNLYCQFFSSKSLEIILTIPHFKNYTSQRLHSTFLKLSEVIFFNFLYNLYKKNKENSNKLEECQKEFSKIFQIVHFMIDHPQAYTYWLVNFNFPLSYIKSICASKNNKVDDFNHDYLRLIIDFYCIDLIDQIISKIKNLPNQKDRIYLYQQVLKCSIEQNLLEMEDQQQQQRNQGTDEKNRFWYTNTQRIFGSILNQLISENISQAEINQLYISLCQNDQQKLNQLSSYIIRMLLKSLQYFTIKQKQIGKIVIPQSQQYLFVIISQLYKSNKYILYDRDLVSLQSLFFISDLNQIFIPSLLNSLQITLTTHQQIDFSQITKQQNNQNQQNQQEQQKSLQELYYEFFFEILLILTIDEIAQINVSSLIKSHKKYFYNNETQNYIENLLIHTFQFKSSMNYQSLIKQISDLGLTKEVNIRSKILQLADLNKDEKLFTQKKEFQASKNIEPFYFLSNLPSHSQFQQLIIEMSQKDDCYDPIIGSVSRKLQYTQVFKIQKLGECSVFFNCLIFVFENNQQFQNQNNLMLFKYSIKFLFLFLQQLCPLMIKYITQNQEQIDQTIKQIKQNKEFLISIFKFETLLKQVLQNQQQNSNKNIIIKIDNNQQQQEEFKQSQQQLQLQNQQSKKNKQQELLNKYKLKQQDFLQKNIELVKQNTQNSNDNLEKKICMICQSSQQEDQILSICTFIQKDNLHQFYNSTFYFEQQDQNQQKQQKLQQSQQNDKNYTLTSCNHYLHKTCHENNRQSAIFLKYSLSDDINYRQIESFCNQCKFLNNLFVPIIDDYIQETSYQAFVQNLSQQQLQQFDYNKFLQFTKFQAQNLQINIKIKFLDNQKQNQILNQIQNDFLNYLSAIFESLDGNEIFLIQYQVSKFLLEDCFVFGIQQFLQRKSNLLLKNFFLSISLIKTIDKNQQFDQQFFQNFLLISLEQLSNLEKSILNSFEQNQIFELDRLLINFATALQVLHQYTNQDQLQFEFLFSFFQEFLQKLKIIYTFLVLKQSLIDQQQKISLQQLKEGLLQINIQQQAQSYLMPYHRLIIGIFASFYKLDQKLLKQIEDQNLDQDQELFLFEQILGKQFYQFQQFQNYYNSDAFLLKIQSQIEVFNQNQNFRQQFLTKNPCQKFMIEGKFIQQNFLETHAQNFFKKCVKCNDYPITLKSSLYLCLICGDVLCSISCNNNKQQSNLFDHAEQNHFNKTIFMELQNGFIFLFENEKCVKLKTSIFYDDLGQHFINQPYSDWKEFKLDQKIMQNIQRVVLQRKISQEIRYQILMSNFKIEDQYFVKGSKQLSL